MTTSFRTIQWPCSFRRAKPMLPQISIDRLYIFQRRVICIIQDGKRKALIARKHHVTCPLMNRSQLGFFAGSKQPHVPSTASLRFPHGSLLLLMSCRDCSSCRKEVSTSCPITRPTASAPTSEK